MFKNHKTKQIYLVHFNIKTTVRKSIFHIIPFQIIFKL